jgi:hypothetical protein
MSLACLLLLQAAEAARLLSEEVEQVLAHLDATGGSAVNRSKVRGVVA